MIDQNTSPLHIETGQAETNTQGQGAWILPLGCLSPQIQLLLNPNQPSSFTTHHFTPTMPRSHVPRPRSSSSYSFNRPTSYCKSIKGRSQADYSRLLSDSSISSDSTDEAWDNPSVFKTCSARPDARSQYSLPQRAVPVLSNSSAMPSSRIPSARDSSYYPSHRVSTGNPRSTAHPHSSQRDYIPDDRRTSPAVPSQTNPRTFYPTHDRTRPPDSLLNPSRTRTSYPPAATPTPVPAPPLDPIIKDIRPPGATDSVYASSQSSDDRFSSDCSTKGARNWTHMNLSYPPEQTGRTRLVASFSTAPRFGPDGGSGESYVRTPTNDRSSRVDRSEWNSSFATEQQTRPGDAGRADDPRSDYYSLNPSSGIKTVRQDAPRERARNDDPPPASYTQDPSRDTKVKWNESANFQEDGPSSSPRPRQAHTDICMGQTTDYYHLLSGDCRQEVDSLLSVTKSDNLDKTYAEFRAGHSNVNLQPRDTRSNMTSTTEFLRLIEAERNRQMSQSRNEFSKHLYDHPNDKIGLKMVSSKLSETEDGILRPQARVKWMFGPRGRRREETDRRFENDHSGFESSRAQISNDLKIRPSPEGPQAPSAISEEWTGPSREEKDQSRFRPQSRFAPPPNHTGLESSRPTGGDPTSGPNYSRIGDFKGSAYPPRRSQPPRFPHADGSTSRSQGGDDEVRSQASPSRIRAEESRPTRGFDDKRSNATRTQDYESAMSRARAYEESTSRPREHQSTRTRTPNGSTRRPRDVDGESGSRYAQTGGLAWEKRRRTLGETNLVLTRPSTRVCGKTRFDGSQYSDHDRTTRIPRRTGRNQTVQVGGRLSDWFSGHSEVR